MQRLLGFLLAGLLLILIGLCITQSRRLEKQKSQITALEAKLQQESKKTQLQQSTIKKLQQQKLALDNDLQKLAHQTSQLLSGQANVNPVLSAPADESQGKGLGAVMSKVMSDPAMKDAVRAQQAQMFGTMYGPLFKDLKLTPQETEKLKALLLDNQLKAAERGIAIMQSNPGNSDGLKELADAKKETEAQIKSMLGDARFALYAQYSQSLPDRMALNQFGMQLENPLNDQQAARLLALITDERRKAADPALDAAQSDPTLLLKSSELADRFLQREAAINKRVLDQVSGLLTPAQVREFAVFQNNQLNMRRLGLNTAQQMMSGSRR